MKVLVVDDEMIIRVGIQSILERSGGIYTYAGSAGSGKAALKEMEKEMPDIVVTDIKMPEMDGIQLIKEIKRRKMPVGIIVLSSYSEFELVREAMKQGASDYVLKLSMTEESLMGALDEAAKSIAKEKKSREKSRPVKLLLSDYLSQTGEMQEDDALWKVGGGDCLVTCVCLKYVQEGKEELSGEAVEHVVENLFNEVFTTWCIKLDDMAYGIVVFSNNRTLDEFRRMLRQMCGRCRTVLHDILNINACMYMGTMENHPNGLRRALQHALDQEGHGPADEHEGKRQAGDQWSRVYQVFRNTRKREYADQYPPAVRRSLEYMNQYYNRDLTLNEISDLVNLNPSYFSFLFNTALTITFSNYLMCLRIHHSKKFLKETNLKIFEIAEMVGYRNSYYFNRIFKRITGVTPMEYRKG